MTSRTLFQTALVGLFTAWTVSGAEPTADEVTSPNGRIHLSVEFPKPEQNASPSWSLRFGDKSLFSTCRLGLQTATGGDLLSGTRLVGERRRSQDERIPLLFGKADHANDRFQEARFILETRQKSRVEVLFRCYDDAVAFRYELPASGGREIVRITDETTSFAAAGDPESFVQYLENYNTSHEHTVNAGPYSGIKSGTLLDLPLTLRWADGTTAAITEAALRHYAGMALMRDSSGDAGDRLVCRLTPRPDGAKVVRPLPLQTPWRVVLMGNRPGALLESTTLYCLNEPSVIKDTSWIKPGKITFHWWNGDVYDGKPGGSILSFEMAKKYIDFCARNGLPTHSLSSTEVSINPWYHQSSPGVTPGPDTDVTRPRDDFDLPRIRAYADSKGVRLWTWVHQGALRGRVEQAFAAFEKMGWSGMMVDFFDHDDQDTVEFAESILQAAARHKILIHFHGVWKPTGWERTYPNLMNHEGALNLEYLKWSDICTPAHDLMMAFTRLVAGPMDYHLGGFRAVPRAQFKPQGVAPHVLGTRCHMLGLYVCYDNPNPMLADYPTAYEGQPGFEFLLRVPTWWDETRVLDGQIGELLVTARRKGTTWYVGAISANAPRDVRVPLSFLGHGRYAATIWKDAPDSEAQPNHLTTDKTTFSRDDTLQLHVSSDGGFVAELVPEN